MEINRGDGTQGGEGKECDGNSAADENIQTCSLATDLWKIAVDININKPATLWRFPLETISNSETGFERNYQGTTLLFWWPLSLQPGQTWSVDFNLDLRLL